MFRILLFLISTLSIAQTNSSFLIFEDKQLELSNGNLAKENEDLLAPIFYTIGEKYYNKNGQLIHFKRQLLKIEDKNETKRLLNSLLQEDQAEELEVDYQIYTDSYFDLFIYTYDVNGFLKEQTQYQLDTTKDYEFMYKFRYQDGRLLDYVDKNFNNSKYFYTEAKSISNYALLKKNYYARHKDDLKENKVDYLQNIHIQIDDFETFKHNYATIQTRDELIYHLKDKYSYLKESYPEIDFSYFDFIADILFRFNIENTSVKRLRFYKFELHHYDDSNNLTHIDFYTNGTKTKTKTYNKKGDLIQLCSYPDELNIDSRICLDIQYHYVDNNEWDTQFVSYEGEEICTVNRYFLYNH